ncbi:MAG: methyltransferase [Nanoarchaeota archaeon]|nr:methyltransferase [Nanoarchaeota archaeon]
MLEIDTDDNVYPPSDDSLLLVKAADKARGEVLDLCAGTGIIGINAAKYAQKVTFAEINPMALKLIEHNARINNLSNIEIVRSDLFSELGERKFDVIFVNPPYLPGTMNSTDFLDLATIGGEKGNETTIKIIKDLSKHLKEGGEAFIVVSTASDLDEVFNTIESLNMKYEIVDSKSYFFEELKLIRIYR